MAASNPAVDWWETDPDSPGNLERSDITYWIPDCANPGLLYLESEGCDDGVYTRPMFEVLPQ